MALLNALISQCPYPALSSFTQLNKGRNVTGNIVRVPSLRKGSQNIKCVLGERSTPIDAENVDRVLKRHHFPKDFIFGAGTSAYQVEGAHKEHGKGTNIWDTFTHQFPEKIHNGDNGDYATNSYNLFREDIQMLKEMGMDSYRLSISWTRILPKGNLSGGINQAGIDYYNNLINELLRNGIQPFVTLFHWDAPQYLQDDHGGFLSKSSVKDFADYCDICFKNFGDRVKHWTTVNEPSVFTLFGYETGAFAPGRCTPSLGCPAGNSGIEPYTVTHNLLLAHGTAAKLYREKYKPTQAGEIGMVLYTEWYLPYSDSAEDREAANRMKDFLIGWYLGPLVHGEYPLTMRHLVKDRLPIFREAERELVKGSCDFIGINYYTSRYAKNNPILRGPETIEPLIYSTYTPTYTHDTHVEKLTVNANGVPIGPRVDEKSFIYIYPEGLKDVLLYVKENYKNPKLYITENGVSKSDEMAGKPDGFRVEYIERHLQSLKEAMLKGVMVKGYFYWALVDNFEWADGYSKRFGLVFINYDDQYKRSPNESAEWFKNFLKQEKAALV